jgi:uroporphyrin-III C-methyltransferase/precorrin-2 dehydrogenase/sirohydrochlorin ferrochelatase
MGVSTAGTVARRLIEHGMDPATPAAIVENGTRADEVVVVGTVAELERMVAANRIVGPAVIVVGDVVRLAGEEALPALARAAAV